MKKMISIIVPICNSEKWLARCIESIIDQTYKKIEIILVDDGSTDTSLSICMDYANKDNRVVVIHQNNHGASVARNKGIKKAHGEFIKFVDSDDTLEKECCELLLDNMKEDVDLVICGLNVYKNNVLLRSPHLDNKTLNIRNDIESYKYIMKVFASPCNKLYRKNLIKNSYKRELELGEDLVFNLDYLKHCNRVKTIENCLYNVCLDNNLSLNRKYRDDRLDISLKLVEEQVGFCNELYGEYDDAFLKDACVRSVHAHFRNVVKMFNYREYKKVFLKYQNNKIILWALNGCNFDRKDYNIFVKLLKDKKILSSYLFFKAKIVLSRR